MVQKVLILGGTRFFGKKLVERFIRHQAEVTIVTRGLTEDSFGDAVRRLHVDRTDADALREALGSEAYDLVYDNICYMPETAEEAVRLFENRTGKYIVTSSVSVYPFDEERISEAAFDPYSYALPDPAPATIDYGEGKRLVEAVLFRHASFPAAAVRFPIVLGHDDYTRRLHFHVEHVQNGEPMGIPNLDAKISFIDADEAADFLFWLGQSTVTGPVNACSDGETTPGQLLSWIEQATGKKAVVRSETEAINRSPFGIPASWYFDNAKAQKEGFEFRQLNEWMPKLIREIAAAD
ncbi:NAD-dependent epimerase/dehydratase family protein [Paenibacillus solisilvae]|uniref:NAD-dependent epimerase/dehydratase family protein n=1 Tax=Paenibacillus solisilvae TaxID=2486751 RepID=A0ABW0VW01_9BACL